MHNIGFIGLGHMGLPMAINLINAGYNVTGFDVNEESLLKLIEARGLATQSLSDLVINQDIIITMLQNGEQVKQVCLGNNGIYAKAKHITHVDCSSIDVRSTQLLHKEANAHNVLAIDAPVSGGVNAAHAGTLTFMVGGHTYVLEKAMPYLLAMGKKIIYTGSSGTGQAAKICNNMILGVTMIAVAEAFVLAEELGLSAEKLFEVVTNSSGQCWVMNCYPPVANLTSNVPANNAYKPGFKALMMLKDLKLSQQSAMEVGVNTQMAEYATLIYERFIDAGFGELDFSAIINAIKKQPQNVLNE